MIPGFGKLISPLLDGVGSILDDLHTSDDERNRSRERLAALKAEVLDKTAEFDRELIVQQSKNIRQEARGGWLTANWRPIVMLTLTGCMVAHWLGLSPDTLSDAAVEAMFELLTVGIGGYVLGRSAEKIAKTWTDRQGRE